MTGPALTTLLRGVQRREAGRRRWRRLGWAVTVGLGTLALGGLAYLLHAPLGVPSPSPALTAGLAGLLGGLTALGLEVRATPPGPQEAARLADRRLGLHDLLGTALTLPGQTGDPLEVALHTRIRAQAEEAARPRQAADVVPPPSPTWARVPAGLAALALLVWLLPPLPAPVRLAAPAEARAEVLRTPEPVRATAGEKVAPATLSPSPSPASPAAPPTGTQPKTPAVTAQANAGKERPGVAVSGAAGTRSRAPGLDRPREAQTSLVEEARSPGSAGPGGGSTRDTPFGSREGGHVPPEELRSNPDALAAAPYDPGGPGSQTQHQKNSGPPELRQASGGRGVESEGRDRCVQGCLTNNDMNRGQTPRASKPSDPEGHPQSGTSDSGGGAAGSTSSVGLGSGRLPDITVRYRQQLLAGNPRNAERVRVLAAPGASPPEPAPGAATAGPWTAQPEPPLTPDHIPDAARDTVRAYFRRTP
ncbi:hypothetical protein E5F05_06020 [Deinococcus metallilatus]|uniref:Uncharacterized protein n=1 Tax=Deinococcus metallilatus TaxID=1211322 RepID=A0AAJ5F481_9DEIO|nr:hypothetical protein [Deinococcus metallilatus]MBB5294495.1 hypothetical protein [Deinococcus metallilatus]QBY07546.1 hypothetical protein E5F05_06020 [Deinococcus metallilatus]RXJ13962.1 hypothetical protein ERJ73_04855 [Deinococcus metallilatus]TLK29927.1 hypothetical protein FCS05_05170 [Deinococcus metallilatus]GMA15710.1 hypothetical protein GCM10025871_20410 [Deinococcus metallilatus]